MRRFLMILIFIMAMGSMTGLAANPVGEPDFRGVQWGMAMKDVRKIETLKLTKKVKEVLLYDTELAGLPCALMYQFRTGVLVGASYIFADSIKTPKEYLADYNLLKALLSDAYGKPTQDVVIWSDDRFKAVPSMWRMAVATGELEYRTVWENQRTQAVLGIRGIDDKLVFAVWYFGREELAKREETLKGM